MSDRFEDLKQLDDSSQDQDDESDEDGDGQPAEPDDTPEPDSESAPDAGDESGGESDTNGEPDAETETETGSTPSMNTTEEEAETTTTDSTSSSPPADMSESEPPYSGDAYTQHTIYTMEETWNEYDDAMERMQFMILRQQFDIRNVAARELNEAMIRLARDNPELMAERVLEARGYDVDLSDE